MRRRLENGARTRLALAPTVFLALALAFLVPVTPAKNLAARLALSHFAEHGLRLPTRQFSAALQQAAIDVSDTSCRSSTLVILAMANEEALIHTIPPFLSSLSRILLANGQHAGQALDAHIVLVTWSLEALKACRMLQAQFKHQCVRDAEHAASTGSFRFHDVGFNSLGFAKIKYILNGLSTGHDVVFLDADVLLLRNPLPYFLSSGAHLLGAMEKCLVFNTSLHLHAPEFLSQHVKPPAINIGVLYFKSAPGVARCVFNWAMEMYTEVHSRPKVWDQDIYFKVMTRCSATHGLRLQVLDPRMFQSACYPGCGCTYRDDEINESRIGMFSRGYHPIKGGMCKPQHWQDVLLRHFPCTGATELKGKLMKALLEGVIDGKPAAILNS